MTTQTNLKSEILRLENDYWQAIKDRDVEAALRLTHDPCIVAGASGVATVGREAFRQIMNSAQYTLRSFSIDPEAQVQQLGDDVVLLAYKVTEDLTVDGTPLTLKAADTSVWHRRDGTWRCGLHTESVLGDAYGRDRVSQT